MRDLQAQLCSYFLIRRALYLNEGSPFQVSYIFYSYYVIRDSPYIFKIYDVNEASLVHI